MRIHVESEIGHPRALVYPTYRDRMPEVAAHIPDIEAIIERSREERPGGPKIHNEWVSRTELPRFVRAFVSADRLRWDDYADWSDEDFAGTFVVTFGIFTEQIRWQGRNQFLASSVGSTTVRVEGEIDIDVRSIPGVPGWVAGPLKPRLERYVARVVSDNIHQMNTSVERHLADLG